MTDLTPMKRQFRKIKEENPDSLLFFRLGDFYEMFEEDAITASKILNLTLTTRDRNKPPEEQTPMCGVPYHAARAYIGQLLERGYKVAICDQLDQKPRKNSPLMRREVVRILSPGTVTDGEFLDARSSNYIGSVYLADGAGAAAFCDVSTGEFCAAAFSGEHSEEHIINELGRFSPREIVVSEGAAESRRLGQFMDMRLRCLKVADDGRFELDPCEQKVKAQFGVENAEEPFGGSVPAVLAGGALLTYISETQKCDMANIRSVDLFEGGKYMELDYATQRNLELTKCLSSGERRGSLLSVLDMTKSPMGARTLRAWVERPLLSVVAIKRRLAAVTELRQNSVMRGELRRCLANLGDMQRLMSRVVNKTASGRDLLTLCECGSELPRIVKLLTDCSSPLLREIFEMDSLEDVTWYIERAVCDKPPVSIREGGILREGYSEEVDRLRKIRDNGAQMVAELEARERERTDIKKLKVGYNKVFGYYIDIPNSAKAGELPPEYIRRQTTSTAERYYTAELKELETEIASASERICELEYDYFCELRDRVAEQVDRVQEAADHVGVLDALCSLAEVSLRQNYCCPEVDLSGEIHIADGRHPVVEYVQSDSLFVPNDTHMNTGDDRVAIITGPNMAGKSTYMRQTALICIMAQIGSYVPAKSATLGIVDRVFTRIGASDDLAGGQSTFMVEMTEVAEILRNATRHSLIILDEVGRGTSTYDGVAIARAVLEYCADPKTLGAKTLFSTHYHELTVLEDSMPGVRNYYITAKKKGEGLIFLRRVVRGSAEDSYGIEVAQLAGVPQRVVKRARTCLDELVKNGGSAPAPVRMSARAADYDGQLSLGDTASDEVLARLKTASVETMSPIEAMNLLYELKRKLEG